VIAETVQEEHAQRPRAARPAREPMAIGAVQIDALESGRFTCLHSLTPSRRGRAHAAGPVRASLAAAMRSGTGVERASSTGMNLT
jgi:hypothetical protein